MKEYEKGYIDGVNDLLRKIQAYYNTLGDKTSGYLVAYTAESAANSLIESISGGGVGVLSSEEKK